MQQNVEQTFIVPLRPSRTRWFTRAVVLGAFVVAVSAGMGVAQSRVSQGGTSRRSADTIPSEYKPPAGMCRVWVDGVPAAQQPAPTDCSTANLKKPANARVVYGEDPKSKNTKLLAPPPVKGFNGSPVPVKKGAVTSAIPLPGAIDRRFRDPRERDAREGRRIDDEQLFGDRPAYQPASSYPGTQTTQPGYGPIGSSGGTGVLGDPRYFAGGAGAGAPGTGSGVCLDRDQDGWCDDLRYGPPVCLDRDRDGRCDDLPEYASQAYPQTLPRMSSAVDVIEGRGSVEVARWLGTNEFTVRVPDQASGGNPWRALFLDGRNELVQVWTDRNRDGLVERVEIFRNGQRVKLFQR